MGNSNTSVEVVPAYEWINLLAYDVQQDVYGLTGWVKWNTKRNPKVQEVSSIHLDQNPTFRKLFKWAI